MRIGVPKEIKNHKYLVGLPPSSVFELVHHGPSGAWGPLSPKDSVGRFSLAFVASRALTHAFVGWFRVDCGRRRRCAAIETA